MPFDWQTPFGYLIAIIVDCNGVFCSAVCYIPVYSIYVGSCLIIAFLIDDIVTEVSDLKMDLLSNGNHQEFRACFSNIVLRISHARQLSKAIRVQNL